jgi:hypothetical protein
MTSPQRVQTLLFIPTVNSCRWRSRSRTTSDEVDDYNDWSRGESNLIGHQCINLSHLHDFSTMCIVISRNSQQYAGRNPPSTACTGLPVRNSIAYHKFEKPSFLLFSTWSIPVTITYQLRPSDFPFLRRVLSKFWGATEINLYINSFPSDALQAEWEEK